MADPATGTVSQQEFISMSDEEALYQEEVLIMEKRGRRVRRAALTAGIFQAVSLICTIYTTIAVRWVLIEWNQPDKTAYEIGENMPMFKFGILTESIVSVCDLMVGVLLGMIMVGAGVNPATSSTIIIFKVMQQAVVGVSVIFLFVASVLLDADGALYKTMSNYFYSDNMPPIGTQIAYLMLLLNKYGVIFSQVFGGIHYSIVGFTIIMWGVFPRWMGYFIFLSGPCLIASVLNHLVTPGYDGEWGIILSLPLWISQFWLTGWMLVNTPHPAKNRDLGIFTPESKDKEEQEQDELQ